MTPTFPTRGSSGLDGEVRMGRQRGQLQRRGPARLWQRLTHLSLLGKLAAALFVTSCANEAALFLPLSGVWQLAVQLAVFAVAFTAALLWFRGSVIGPITAATQRARALAAGDLRAHDEVALGDRKSKRLNSSH